MLKQARDEARKQARIRRHEKAVEVQMAIEDRAAARRLMQELAELDRDLIRYAARFKVRVRPDKPSTHTSPVEKRVTATPVKEQSRRPVSITTASSWVIDDHGMRGIIWQQSYLGRKSPGFYRGAARDNWEYDVRDEAVLLDASGEPIIITNMGDDWVEVGAGWQALEDASVRKNAKIQIRAIAPFDADMSIEEMAFAVRHFCETVLEPLGLPYSAVLHKPSPDGDQRNFHPHISFSLRPMRRVAIYEWEIADEVRGELDGKDGVQLLRHLWAHSMTAAAEQARSNRAYTGLGYGARGLNLEAGEHLGEARAAMLKRGEYVWAHERNRIKSVRNAARRAVRDAEKKIEALTKVRDAALAAVARSAKRSVPARRLLAARPVPLNVERLLAPAVPRDSYRTSQRLILANVDVRDRAANRMGVNASALSASAKLVAIADHQARGHLAPSRLSPPPAPLSTTRSLDPVVAATSNSELIAAKRLYVPSSRVGADEPIRRLATPSGRGSLSPKALATAADNVRVAETQVRLAVSTSIPVAPRLAHSQTPGYHALPSPMSRLTASIPLVVSQAIAAVPQLERVGGAIITPARRSQAAKEDKEWPRLERAPTTAAADPFGDQLARMLDALAAAHRARERAAADKARERKRLHRTILPADQACEGIRPTGGLAKSPASARGGRHERRILPLSMTGWSTRRALETRSWYEANPRSVPSEPRDAPLNPVDRQRLDRIQSLDLYVADYGGGVPLEIDGAKAHALGLTDGWLARPDIQRELGGIRGSQQRAIAALAETAMKRPLDFSRTGSRFWPSDLETDLLKRLDRWAMDDGFRRDVSVIEQQVQASHDANRRSRPTRDAARQDRRTEYSEPVPDGFGGLRDTPAPLFNGELPDVRIVAFDRASGKPTAQLLMLLDLAAHHPRAIELAADGRLMANAGAPALMAPLLHGWRGNNRVADLVTETVKLSREQGRPTWPEPIASSVRDHIALRSPASRAPIDWSTGPTR
ncbi:MAG: hypothetical protein J0J06_13880 [Sphingomonas sp.]|uniref:hypothetical protein n=1 Tax=Sphingomonas sp. TaxID=28214 RepID=UPI001ACEA976|nr:hypothetical protein [Sphingomonas sp.]MBN8816524.1 hypothetical protein [Sphingomonas sp.]